MQVFGDPLQRNGRDLLRQRESLRSRVDDEQMAKTEVVQRGRHRAGHRRLRGQLELDPPSFVPAYDEKIELGAAVRGPEEALFAPEIEDGRDLLQREPFPR